jgi:hypothetical protein
LKLDNGWGKAAATDWKLTMATPRGSRIVPREVGDPSG